MAVMTIREKAKTETGFEATLIIKGKSYPITVNEPSNTKQEQELEWYFEDWLIYPMLDNVKADRAKASVREYGEQLFQQVFQSNSEAYLRYSHLKQNLSQLTIEIVSINPEFQAIHWETLRDPEFEHPLAIDTILIRKSSQSKKIAIEVKESPTINLLVVVARPNAEDDIPHRTISRPLVETIRKAKLRVNIEILRPGTYEALAKHLEAKGNGYYHIVHFDVHGSLQSYETYQERLKIGIYPESRYGREEIKEYEGFKAFLAFEGEDIGEYDPVEASEIANLLTSKDIPICILNACQSGKQLRSSENEDNRETSLGSRFMNAGMQMVVAMSYSVTVTAAEIMMQQLYEHLFDTQDINQAILLGRKELYNRKARKAAYNTEIDLEDWLLPVVYSNGEVNFNLREFTPEEATEYDLNLESKYKFVDPNYGFVGRDIDILLIEKDLLYHNILLLQGMGGTGKTTLLNYLQKWWQDTKFVEDTFYFAYDKRAYNLQQIIFEISKQLYDGSSLEDFQSKNLSEQCQKISQELCNKPYLIILDNLESITGQPLAIQNTLEETEKAEIKNFLASLVGGKTKVTLGSRIAEEWLQKSTFQDNSYQLRGLDDQASYDLAANILRGIESNQSLDKIETNEYFQWLMTLLAGNPLAIKVILPNLKNKSPKEVVAQLEKARISLGRNNKQSNLLKCIEYSYNNLSESSQKLLLSLAPFRRFINVDLKNLYIYIKELNTLEFFQDYNLEQLEESIQEAIQWGLLSPIGRDLPEILIIHPVLPLFLNTKIKQSKELTAELIQKCFTNHYQILADYYNDLIESIEPQNKRAGIVIVTWEYENIFQALDICLEKKEIVNRFWSCLFNYLGQINNSLKQLKLTQYVCDHFNIDMPEKCINAVQQEEVVSIYCNLANCYQKNNNYSSAIDIYQNIWKIISQFKHIQDSQKQIYRANVYHNLGVIAHNTARDSKELEEAKNYYIKALDMGNQYRDKWEKVCTIRQLGSLMQDLGDLEEAEKYYQQALDLYRKSNNKYAQAAIFQNLGMLSEMEKLVDPKKIKDYYQQAFNIYIEYGDEYSQASTLSQLGIVSQYLQNPQEARDYYQQALDIYIKYGDDYSQARIYALFGIIEEELLEWEQAKSYFLKALKVFKKDSMRGLKIQKYLGGTLIKLATVNKKMQDNELCQEVAEILEITEREVVELFNEYTINN